MGLENEKTEGVNKHKSKENKNVEQWQEHILQQNSAWTQKENFKATCWRAMLYVKFNIAEASSVQILLGYIGLVHF